jgi:hypothetical protein
VPWQLCVAARLAARPWHLDRIGEERAANQQVISARCAKQRSLGIRRTNTLRAAFRTLTRLHAMDEGGKAFARLRSSRWLPFVRDSSVCKWNRHTNNQPGDMNISLFPIKALASSKFGSI